MRLIAEASGYSNTTVRDHLRGLRQRDPIGLRGAVEEAAAALGVDVPKRPWEVVPDPVGDAQRLGHRRTPNLPSSAAPNPPALENEEMTPTLVDLDFLDLEYWKLPRDPFGAIDPLQSWSDRRRDYTINQLVRGIECRQIVALCGGVGMGKSTLLRRLHALLASRGAKAIWLTPGNLDRRQISEGSLATAMLRDLQVGELSSTSAERRGELLRKELDRRAREGEFPVLAIDEAHDLSVTGLIAIKRIWDSFTFNRSLGVLLAGQLPLVERLRRDPRVREVAGRTRVLELPPLDVEDATSYLAFRLARVGKELGDVFAEGAVAAMVRRGGCAPLWLDAHAAGAMQLARRLSEELVTAAIVART